MSSISGFWIRGFKRYPICKVELDPKEFKNPSDWGGRPRVYEMSGPPASHAILFGISALFSSNWYKYRYI